MKRKVVYSPRFGGFGLSTEAVLLARQLSGNPKWGDVTLYGETYSDGTVSNHDYNSYDPSNITRHDPILVQVVEELGSVRASGKHADLKIEEVEGKYRIDEYDGNEQVMTPDSYEWID